MGLIYYDNSGVQHELEDWRIIHKSKVDFNKDISPLVISVTQYDINIPIIAVELFNNDQKYTLDNNMSVRVRLKKKDGYIVYNPVLGYNQERTMVYFEITQQMSVLCGEIYPILEISVNSNAGVNIAGSSYIPILIRKNPIQNGDTESSQEIQDLSEIIAEARALIAEFEEDIQKISGLERRTTNIENKFENGMTYSNSTQTLKVPFTIQVED